MFNPRTSLGLLRALRTPVTYGNRIELLVNGEQYFPRLLQAIDNARRSVHLETYIYADDNIGQRVTAALAAAAGRGVQVRVLVDGFGSAATAQGLRGELTPHGATVKVFRPPRWWRLERSLLRRMHRKLVVVDAELADQALAFVGGINVIDDHNVPPHERGRIGPRFDFAVVCSGPIVASVATAMQRLWRRLSLLDGTAALRSVAPTKAAPTKAHERKTDGIAASLLIRDNLRHRRSIERAYLAAIALAKRDIIIANAYFLPGRRLRAALRAAAQRGVRVRLLLQGRVEYRVQHHAQRALYGQLLSDGKSSGSQSGNGSIEIHEYERSYLHAKVAVVDDQWATVGSSNIDPYSLLLAQEANIAVYDAAVSGQLRAVLEQAIAQGPGALDAARIARRAAWVRLMDWIAYGLVRFATVVLAKGRGY